MGWPAWEPAWPCRRDTGTQDGPWREEGAARWRGCSRATAGLKHNFSLSQETVLYLCPPGRNRRRETRTDAPSRPGPAQEDGPDARKLCRAAGVAVLPEREAAWGPAPWGDAEREEQRAEAVPCQDEGPPGPGARAEETPATGTGTCPGRAT